MPPLSWCVYLLVALDSVPLLLAEAPTSWPADGRLTISRWGVADDNSDQAGGFVCLSSATTKDDHTQASQLTPASQPAIESS